MLVSPSLGAVVGVGFFLLVMGALVQHICFPARCQTWGWWMATSLVFIPLGFLGASLIAAYPPLLFAALFGAAGVSHWRKKRRGPRS